MSTDIAGDSGRDPQYADAIRAIYTRIDEIERQQRKDEEEERQHNRSQLKVNRTIAIFTGLLFATSVVSDGFLFSELDNAKKSLANAIRQNLLDQRAWVGPVEFSAPEQIEAGKHVYLTLGQTEFQVSALVVNNGKTPASHFRNVVGIRSGVPGQKFFPGYANLSFNYGDTVVQPGARVPVSTGRFTYPALFNKATIDGIRDGKLTVYVFGLVVYNDVFGTHHFSSFCSYIGQDRASMKPCYVYNNGN